MAACEEWHLETRHIGRRVQVHKRLESTNTEAANRADDPTNHGLVILAHEQTSGRGQQGRSWQAPAGKAILMSVLVMPPAPLRRPALLTAWAAVSVCETIRQATGLQARIKWPNDVLIRGRKVCGILIESKAQAFQQDNETEGNRENRETLPTGLSSIRSDLAVVAGIGLNVTQTARDFEAAGLPQAGSLALSTGRTFDCPTVARMLVQQLDEEYDRLNQGDFDSLVTCWKWHIGLLGRQVAVEAPNGRHWGRLKELTLDGVELEQTAGRSLLLPPEAVRHLEPA
jgi:BirA family biotin operon repressor/biotin-[acetyl-CoA-carboxylase] ligase